jgi:ribosomal protein S18 acetylase RimI-like enzyme
MLRSATDADRNDVLALGVAEEIAWFGSPENSAEEIGEWVDYEGGIASGVVDVDDAENIRAFAAPGERESILMADPAHATECIDNLLPWLREHGTVQLMTFSADDHRVHTLERHGLHHIRSSFSLARSISSDPLPQADWPEGVTVEPYRLGDDDEGVHSLIYVAAEWASVPGHNHRELDAWRETLGVGLRAFIARRGKSLTGWVAGRILDSGKGYVSGLAVARSERGLGLGRALLLHSATDLLDAGAAGLALDAVASNEAALALYQSVGFAVDHEWRVYADPADPD